MALTVPTSGVIAGRAAQPVADTGVGAVGGAISEFGQRIAETFGRVEADRLDREMSRINVDMTRDLGQLRLQVEQMGDPDAAGAAWDQGRASIRDQYLNGQTDSGRPRVDPKNRENFGLAFDDLSNTHALAIGRMNMEQRHGSQKPVIKKALVELDGKPFKAFAKVRDEWAVKTSYAYTGAIQYYGPAEVCDQPTKTLLFEKS
jgi:hypothetical protein